MERNVQGSVIILQLGKTKLKCVYDLITVGFLNMPQTFWIALSMPFYWRVDPSTYVATTRLKKRCHVCLEKRDVRDCCEK